MKFFILFLFIFSFISSVQSSQKNNLNNLFDQLQNINNSKSAALLEQKIWSIWNEHPNDLKLTEKLEFTSTPLFSLNQQLPHEGQ